MSYDERKVTLGKEYSKDYCKVSIHIETTIDDLQNAVMLMDDYLRHELSKIPDGGFTKEKKDRQDTQTTTTNSYSKPRSASKDFGSAKQWNIINDPKNLAKLNAGGFSPDNISDYETLQAAMKAIFNK